jgi:hypothetical protein
MKLDNGSDPPTLGGRDVGLKVGLDFVDFVDPTSFPVRENRRVVYRSLYISGIHGLTRVRGAKHHKPRSNFRFPHYGPPTSSI